MHPKLESFKLLEKNWDSYGGEPITNVALEQADLLLRCFTALQMVEPWIVPDRAGGVGFEWHRNGFDLEITIGPDGETTDVWFQEATHG